MAVYRLFNVSLQVDLQKAVENEKKVKDAVVQELQLRIDELEKTMQDSQDVSKLRQLERQLLESQAAFEDFKREAQLAAEAMEKKYRDEMHHIVSGNDDTAEAWLEKQKAAQQQIDRLMADLASTKEAHAKELESLKIKYEDELEECKVKCENHENELDNQAQHIQSLLGQIEDLQNSLEAATARLENHTANKKAMSTASAAISEVDAHRMCEQKLQSRQRDLDDLQRRINELKESHETQLQRLGQEKARELQELRKELQGFRELHQTTKKMSEVITKK